MNSSGESHEYTAANEDVQLNVYNFVKKLSDPKADYAALRFDPNNTCNLHCVYCHNDRSDEVIDQELFREFLYTKVSSVTTFQVGCIMEPTLDKRLTDFLLTIASSPAKPTHEFILQTNGVLLHRHDPKKLRDAALTRLSVSMDAADPETQSELRNGTSLVKVVRNIGEFISACPLTKTEFITTVTRSNIGKLDALIKMGLDIGVRGFTFRELFYYPDNKIVDHTKMPSLLLRGGEFQRMREDVLARFSGTADFIFADNQVLHASSEKMVHDSGFVDRKVGTMSGRPA